MHSATYLDRKPTKTATSHIPPVSTPKAAMISSLTPTRVPEQHSTSNFSTEPSGHHHQDVMPHRITCTAPTLAMRPHTDRLSGAGPDHRSPNTPTIPKSSSSDRSCARQVSPLSLSPTPLRLLGSLVTQSSDGVGLFQCEQLQRCADATPPESLRQEELAPCQNIDPHPHGHGPHCCAFTQWWGLRERPDSIERNSAESSCDSPIRYSALERYSNFCSFLPIFTVAPSFFLVSPVNG